MDDDRWGAACGLWHCGDRTWTEPHCVFLWIPICRAPVVAARGNPRPPRRSMAIEIECAALDSSAGDVTDGPRSGAPRSPGGRGPAAAASRDVLRAARHSCRVIFFSFHQLPASGQLPAEYDT